MGCFCGVAAWERGRNTLVFAIAPTASAPALTAFPSPAPRNGVAPASACRNRVSARENKAARRSPELTRISRMSANSFHPRQCAQFASLRRSFPVLGPDQRPDRAVRRAAFRRAAQGQNRSRQRSRPRQSLRNQNDRPGAMRESVGMRRLALPIRDLMSEQEQPFGLHLPPESATIPSMIRFWPAAMRERSRNRRTSFAFFYE
jgi:hypothetical protein